MSTNEEEWEEVVALDGNTYRVLKNPPPPTPPLPITEKEEKALDRTIARLAKVYVDRGISPSASFRHINNDGVACADIDALIVQSLQALRPDVPVEPAEKLFERMSKVIDGWAKEPAEELDALGYIYMRLFDSMRYMVAYKAKFRGKAMERTEFSKEDALRVLRERGLAKGGKK